MALLDSYSMVSDGQLHYPARGIPSVQLLRGSNEHGTEVIDPEALTEALEAHALDMRPFAEVHREAMSLVARDDEGNTSAQLARRLQALHGEADRDALHDIVGCMLDAAGSGGLHVEVG